MMSFLIFSSFFCTLILHNYITEISSSPLEICFVGWSSYSPDVFFSWTIITMLTIATILGNIHEWHHARRGGGYFCYVKYEIVRKDRFIVTGREVSQNIHIWVTSFMVIPSPILELSKSFRIYKFICNLLANR